MSKVAITNTGDTASAPVTAYLYPKGVSAYDPNGNPVVTTVQTNADTTGAWTLQLERTDTMSPSGMAWQVTLGSGSVVYLQFSAGGAQSGLQVSAPTVTNTDPHMLAGDIGSELSISGGGATINDDIITMGANVQALTAAYGGLYVAKVPVTGITGHVAGAGGNWQVPVGGAFIYPLLSYFNVGTIATATCLLDIGYTSVSAATLSDTIMDGIDVHASTGVKVPDALSTGVPTFSGNEVLGPIAAAAGKWVTISAQDSSSDLTGLVGALYIVYSLA